MGVDDKKLLFLCNFEIIIIRPDEVTSAFLSTAIGGCLFHFLQNVLKKINSAHWWEMYMGDVSFVLILKYFQIVIQ